MWDFVIAICVGLEILCWHIISAFELVAELEKISPSLPYTVTSIV